jgi:hypothetical protein
VNRFFLLTTGERSLLARAGDTEGIATIDAEAVLDHHLEKVAQYVKAKEDLLMPLVQEREEVLRQRFELSADITYHPLTKVYTDKLVICFQKDSKIILQMPFAIEGATIRGLDIESAPANEEPDAAEQWMTLGFTVVFMHIVSGIDSKSQIEHVVERHIKKMSDKTGATI